MKVEIFIQFSFLKERFQAEKCVIKCMIFTCHKITRYIKISEAIKHVAVYDISHVHSYISCLLLGILSSVAYQETWIIHMCDHTRARMHRPKFPFLIQGFVKVTLLNQ